MPLAKIKKNSPYLKQKLSEKEREEAQVSFQEKRKLRYFEELKNKKLREGRDYLSEKSEDKKKQQRLRKKAEENLIKLYGEQIMESLLGASSPRQIDNSSPNSIYKPDVIFDIADSTDEEIANQMEDFIIED